MDEQTAQLLIDGLGKVEAAATQNTAALSALSVQIAGLRIEPRLQELETFRKVWEPSLIRWAFVLLVVSCIGGFAAKLFFG